MIQLHETFPRDTLAAVKPVQMDPYYLTALDELCAVKGLRNIAACVQFTAKMFGKSFSDVAIDACDHAAAAGNTFGEVCA